jgi:hypothetical protein
MGHHVGMSFTLGAGALTTIIDNMRPRQPLKEHGGYRHSLPAHGVVHLQARNAKLFARIISSSLEIPSIQGKFKPL